MSKFNEDKSKAVRVITECAVKYKLNLLNKTLLFVCTDRCNHVFTYEVSFKVGNYMHLTGCIPAVSFITDKNGKSIGEKRISAPDFFRNCIKGRISEDSFNFSDNHTTPLKLEVLPYLMEKDISARQIGNYNQRGLVLDSTKIIGNVRACMGLKETETGKLVPNSTLNADIRDYITDSRRVIATYRKSIGTDKFTDIVYSAKGVEWSNIVLPTEYEYLQHPLN